MDKVRNYRKKNIQQKYLHNPDAVEQFELAMNTLLQSNLRFSKEAFKRQGVPREVIDNLYPHYIEEKRARIELNCSIANKKLWQTKAIKASKTVSQLATEALNGIRVYTPKSTFDEESMRKVLGMRSRLNASINQMAKWCNTHGAGVEIINVLAELRDIQNHTRDIDDSLLAIIDGSKTSVSRTDAYNYQSDDVHELLSWHDENYPQPDLQDIDIGDTDDVWDTQFSDGVEDY